MYKQSSVHSSAGTVHGSSRSYLVGLIVSALMTLIPFALVMHPTLPRTVTAWLVVALGAVQIIAHLKFFLHLETAAVQRWNPYRADLFGGHHSPAGRTLAMDHGQYSSQHAGALKQWAGLFNVGLQLTTPGIIFGNLAFRTGRLLSCRQRPPGAPCAVARHPAWYRAGDWLRLRVQ